MMKATAVLCADKTRKVLRIRISAVFGQFSVFDAARNLFEQIAHFRIENFHVVNAGVAAVRFESSAGASDFIDDEKVGVLAIFRIGQKQVKDSDRLLFVFRKVTMHSPKVVMVQGLVSSSKVVEHRGVLEHAVPSGKGNGTL